jgi:hypothetical protein
MREIGLIWPIVPSGPVMATIKKKPNAMIQNFLFRYFSIEKQVEYLQSKGVSLGTRVKDGRKIYVYMLRNLFVEVIYENDNSSESPEKVHILKGLKSLNSHLEREFRASF